MENKITTGARVTKRSNEYWQVHKWLQKEYGKATVCVNPDCPGKSQTYDWALLHGLTYEKNRNNFVTLCRSCHKYYDHTPEMGANMSKAHMGHKHSTTQKQKMREAKLGIALSDEHRLNMSKARKVYWIMKRLDKLTGVDNGTN